MPIWGKLLGLVFGFMFLKIPGAILGLIVGHMFDRAYSQDFNQLGGFARFFSDPDALKTNAVFFHALFASLGHIAKADGRVSEHEIAVASALMDDMQLVGVAREEAQNAFRDGKASDYPLSATLKNLYDACFGRRDFLQIFLEILIQAALSDGNFRNAEKNVLQEVAKTLKFSSRELDFLIEAHMAQQRFRYSRTHSGAQQASGKKQLADAYDILGVSSTDDERTVKRAYKKRMAEHHPDKLTAKGLPKQAMEMAKQKTQDIQAAYEMIKQKQGW